MNRAWRVARTVIVVIALAGVGYWLYERLQVGIDRCRAAPHSEEILMPMCE
jgi:hypothetical protein